MRYPSVPRAARSLLAAGAFLAAPLAAQATAPTPHPAAAPAASAAIGPDAAAVTALADEILADLRVRAPEFGTFLGLPDADHAGLSDNSLDEVRRSEARLDAWRERLAKVDGARLTGRPEYATWAALRETLESQRQARVCRAELTGVNQMFGWQTRFPLLGTVQPVGTPERRGQALARFRKLPAYIDTEIANLREGLRLGYTAPRVNVDQVIEQLDALLAAPAAESPFAGPARRDSAPEFRREFAALVTDGINPALRRYRDFLANEYRPKARTAVAVGANPDGAACYQASVRGFTTVDLAPRAVHELGLRQMERIQGEMRQLAERSFNTTDVPALLRRFKTDTAFTFRTREQIVAYSQAAYERAGREMPKWFGIVPKATMVIEPYPAFEEKSAPRGSYMAPAADGSRPGTYRINTYEPTATSKVGMESTAFHEGIPGHHLQGAIMRERTSLHPLSRFLNNSGYAEGWGLYSERLADEMGLFSGDLDRFGLLSNEAFRAARLVVDPGLHALGWTREQAIDYMLTHTALSRQEAEVEVDRYIAMPGQATAYMVGSLEIRRLRELAEERLGPKFDIRQFHDRVLEDGSLPLPALREKIERWVAQAA